MALFSRETNEEKAINELTAKKEMLMNAVKKEIDNINAQISREFENIGDIVYNNYVDTNEAEISSAKYMNILTNIDEHKANIKEKSIKLEEICDRYDDEIKILKQSLGLSDATCPNCKKPYNQGVDKFCVSCGQKLS